MSIIAIAILVYLLTPLGAPVTQKQEQTGGDPYRNIRLWIIIDVLRNFWLTK